MAHEMEQHFTQQQQQQQSSSIGDVPLGAPPAKPPSSASVQMSAPPAARSFLGGMAEGFMDALCDAWAAAKSQLGYVARSLWQLRVSSSSQGHTCKEAVEGGENVSEVKHSTHSTPTSGSIDIQHLLEESLLNVFVEGLFDIRAEDFPGHLLLLLCCRPCMHQCIGCIHQCMCIISTT
jgi:hypothetical protein